VIRSSERHQAEKDLARQSLKERAQVGEAETNLDMSIQNQDFSSRYTIIPAYRELAELLRIETGTDLLERRFESTDRRTGHLLSASVSYIPKALVEANPKLLDEANEPWPGGTQHQLSTVGIEIMCITDLVTGRMPTTVETQLWGLGDGIPLLVCRRLSLDADNRVVEISDATYPADRTELQFVTPLRAWPKPRSTKGGRPTITRKDARR
jgi:GntR family transcriptional regulator